MEREARGRHSPKPDALRKRHNKVANAYAAELSGAEAERSVSPRSIGSPDEMVCAPIASAGVDETISSGIGSIGSDCTFCVVAKSKTIALWRQTQITHGK
jgi:hypothetical protein